MANIKITVEGPLMDGHKITFKAPCNCDAVEKLDVRYIKDNEQKSKLFTMKDAHGNDLTGLGNLFYKDAYVDVVLDPNSGSAYLQNAGTNGYLEGKTTPVDNLESDRADLPLSARQGKILNESLNVFERASSTIGYGTGDLINYKVTDKLAWLNIEITPTQLTHGTPLAWGLWQPSTYVYMTLVNQSGEAIPCMLNTNGELKVYYPRGTESLSRIDFSTMYPLKRK